MAASVAAHGGKYLVRGGATETIEGDWNPERVVVVEFDSFEQAKSWAEIAELREMRVKSSNVRMILVEGV